MLAGLFPKTGVTSARRMHEATLAPYTRRRRVHYVNRRAQLGPGMTIGALAAEHADAMRAIWAGAPRRALAVAAGAMLPPGPWQLPAALAAAVLAPHALTPADLDDLATTIELEDVFDLATRALPIRAPTLVISGDRDRFYPVSLIEETAALIPGARLRLQPGKGHMTVTGLPAVHGAILDHLDGFDHGTPWPRDGSDHGTP